MSTTSETSDGLLLDLIKRRGPLTVAEMATATQVTATAVRQRLTRLMSQQLVERSPRSREDRHARGRPNHQYRLTERARRQAGSNFADLAVALWTEVRGIKDLEVRRGLLERLASALSNMYGGVLPGDTLEERTASLVRLFEERRIPIGASQTDGLTVLSVRDCPYPELAEKDRTVCSMERMLFARLLDTPLRLTECRLDGHSCCRFEAN